MSAFTKLPMSWARILLSSDRGMRPFTDGRTLANWLMDRILSLTLIASSVLTRSILFRRTLSEKATCWKASLTLPSSTLSSKRPGRCLQSATQRTPSSRSSAVSSGFDMKVRMIGTGSAMPVVSIIMASIALPLCIDSSICFKPFSRSPRMVQHMQPLSITRTFSAMDSFCSLRRASSMDTSPNSFSMIAIFFSRCSCKM
mmetsp:Transcript_106225/g.193352  ORF Transcript_106225/g.193352 Transcript_106225/m.193352 type:complete len:200 (-) Transcript_106225:483-1082(-)